MDKTRTEKDAMGIVNVPNTKLWGAQTQRSLENFSISNEKMPNEVIKALVYIKYAAAQVHKNLKLLNKKYADAITIAASEILLGKHVSEFPLSVWQTGSGTQSNMNVNEVIANRASKILGGEIGENRLIHPNDDVNKSQSSNDVFSSAMNIAAVIALKENLLPKINSLKKTLNKKSQKFKNIIKVGRTHLQDATPITLGQEISGWASMLEHSENHINNAINHISELALGGTAVGTGINTHPEYDKQIVKILTKLIGHNFFNAKNKFEAIATCDALVYSHGTLKSLASSIMKIANDVRFLSSGPRCGIGEIIIPSNEPGSTIMPGKINPTQCESITMICCQVIGNDVSINIGGSSGNLELNVYRPMIIYNFLQSVRLLTDGINSFNKHCISGIQPNYHRINYFLNRSLMLVTALNVHIGYDKSAKIVKKAYEENITLKNASLKLGYITEKQYEEWVKPENMIDNKNNK
ncbi:MAG: class II fumarate hydratase [Enterobacterales bacterium]